MFRVARGVEISLGMWYNPLSGLVVGFKPTLRFGLTTNLHERVAIWLVKKLIDVGF